MVEIASITLSTFSLEMMLAVNFLVTRFLGLQHKAHPAFIFGEIGSTHR